MHLQNFINIYMSDTFEIVFLSRSFSCKLIEVKDIKMTRENSVTQQNNNAKHMKASMD